MARVKTVRFQSGSVPQSLVLPFSDATDDILPPRGKWMRWEKKYSRFNAAAQMPTPAYFTTPAPLNRVITRSGARGKGSWRFLRIVPRAVYFAVCESFFNAREIPLNFRTSDTSTDRPSQALHFPSSCTGAFIHYYPRNFVSYEWHSAKFSKDTVETRSK